MIKMCDIGDQEIPNQDQTQYTDDNNDCNNNPTLGMDVHTTADFKYYMITLAFSILTMFILKLSWKLGKCMLVSLVRNLDDLSFKFRDYIIQKSRLKKQIQRPTNHNGHNLTSYKNGSKINRRTGSTTSLRSIRLSNDSVFQLDMDKDQDNDKSSDKGIINHSNATKETKPDLQYVSNTVTVSARSDSEMSGIEKGVQTTFDSDSKPPHAFGFVCILHVDK